MTHAPWLQPLSPEEPDHEWERPAFERRPRRLHRVVADSNEADWETADLGRGLIETHLAPPRAVWTAALPDHAGFYLIRPAGAPRALWRVVDVYRSGRHFVASWSDVPPRPVSELTDFEFCPIREPQA